MRRLFLLLLSFVALAATPARASEWGNIEPGVTTFEEVRARYGQPTRETRPKVEGYDTLEWVYEGNVAPSGLARMTVEFGFLAGGTYKPNVVRLLTLEPKPLIFGKNTVIQGWGVPDGIVENKEGGSTLIWKDGLIVTFDKANENAVTMIFTVPQPITPSAPPPGRPPQR
jgi:hypothetical protein